MSSSVSVLCFVVSASIVASAAARTIGGSDLEIAAVPYTTSVQEASQGHMCGATIISPDWVITNAWCQSGPFDVSNWTVRAGSTFHGDGGSVHRVMQWIQNPFFDSTFDDFDFALLRVSPAFEFGANCGAVSLPAPNATTPAGAPAIASGWGIDDETRAGLRSANVLIMSDEECATELEDFYTEQRLCAQNGDTVSLCKRDMGGPLVADGTLFGVIQWTGFCSLPSGVQRFARVARQRDWIAAVTGL